MSVVPETGDDDDQEVARQAASMKDQLSKDVASWSKERRATADQANETIRPPVRRAAPSTAGATKKPSRTTPAVVPKGGSKPFSMSYDGVTTDEYIRYMRDRRTR